MTEEASPFIMEDYTTRTYGTGGLDNRPLFGETSARVVGGALFLDYLQNSISCPTRAKEGLMVPTAMVPGKKNIKDRIINLVVGGLTSLLVLVTFISAFVFPQPPPKPVNVFFAVCIFLCSITGLILIFWYRQGDLEPKFRNLIYYILFSVVMLCICANLYFHDVGK